ERDRRLPHQQEPARPPAHLGPAATSPRAAGTVHAGPRPGRSGPRDRARARRRAGAGPARRLRDRHLDAAAQPDRRHRLDRPGDRRGVDRLPARQAAEPVLHRRHQARGRRRGRLGVRRASDRRRRGGADRRGRQRHDRVRGRCAGCRDRVLRGVPAPRRGDQERRRRRSDLRPHLGVTGRRPGSRCADAERPAVVTVRRPARPGRVCWSTRCRGGRRLRHRPGAARVRLRHGDCLRGQAAADAASQRRGL
ncbi:MAG: possible integral membrane protein, partial [uncultured Nocardioidaceae bacterium]